MSWLSLPELEEASLEGASSAGDQYVPWNETATASRCCSPASGTGYCLASPSGMTSPLSTGVHGDGGSTSLLADSPARITAAQAEPRSERDLTVRSLACGGSSPASLRKCNLTTSSLRTFQTCGHYGQVWTSSYKTLTSSGSMRDGLCLLEKKQVPRTFADAFGLLPTPEMTQADYDAEWAREQKLAKKAGKLADEAKFRSKMKGSPGRLPTPTAKGNQLASSMMKHPSGRRLRALLETLGFPPGHLHPAMLEWSMGWPQGWTALQPLEMDKFQEWFKSHGRL